MGSLRRFVIQMSFAPSPAASRAHRLPGSRHRVPLFQFKSDVSLNIKLSIANGIHIAGKAARYPLASEKEKRPLALDPEGVTTQSLREG
jgi:hypothetical protein